MEWEWFLPPPFDFVLHLILPAVRRRKAQRLVSDASNWPKAKGLVTSVTTKKSEDNHFDFQVELNYSYPVNDGDFMGNFLLPAEPEEDAARHAVEWRGRDVVVRYRPTRPGESVVLLNDQAV